jgi:hypothetical protein
MRLRPSPSFDDYIFDACERLESMGGDARIRTTEPMKNQLVLLDAGLSYQAQDVQLRVFEVISRTSKGKAHRNKYCYRCWLESGLVFRFERDPRQYPEMPDHMHLAGVPGRIAGTIDLHPMLDELWDRVEAEKRRRAELARIA